MFTNLCSFKETLNAAVKRATCYLIHPAVLKPVRLLSDILLLIENTKWSAESVYLGKQRAFFVVVIFKCSNCFKFPVCIINVFVGVWQFSFSFWMIIKLSSSGEMYILAS